MERIGFQQRTGAFFIDLGLAMILVHLLIVVDLLLNQFDRYSGTFGLISGGGGALLILLYGLFEIFWARTPGKRIMGLIIAREDGTPASRRILAKRWAVKQSPIVFGALGTWLLIFANLAIGDFNMPDGLSVFGFIDGGIAVFLGVFVCVGCFKVMQPQQQAFHDVVAGTAVFRAVDVQTKRGFVPVVPQPVVSAFEG